MKDDLLERLREAMKRASPLPWCWEQCGDKCDAPVVGVAWRADDPKCEAIAGRLPDFDADGNEIEWYRETIAYEICSQEGCSASANAELIVEGVNALPAMLTHIEQLTAHLQIAIAEHDSHFGKASFVGHWTNLARATLKIEKD